MNFSKVFLLENIRLNIELCSKLMNQTKDGKQVKILNEAQTHLANAENELVKVIDKS